MARATMATLILRVRAMTGDPDTTTIPDDDIQDMFDERRMDVVQAQLSFRPYLVSAGPVVQYRDFWAPVGGWEDGVVLVDSLNALVTADTTDLIRGHWTFATGHLPPLWITGAFYDIYGTAASVLQRWAAQLAREFDFQTDQQVFSRSQQGAGLAALALEYQRKAQAPGQRPAWRSAEW